MRTVLLEEALRLTLTDKDASREMLAVEIEQHVIDVIILDNESPRYYSPSYTRAIPEVDNSTHKFDNIVNCIILPSCAFNTPVVFKYEKDYLNLLGISKNEATFIIMEKIPDRAPPSWIDWFKRVKYKPPEQSTTERSAIDNLLKLELKTRNEINIMDYSNYCKRKDQSDMAQVIEIRPAIRTLHYFGGKSFATFRLNTINAASLAYIYGLTQASAHLTNITRG